jgi:hypothetical protein
VISQDSLIRLISENLRRAWIEEHPSESCFDHSEARMQAMLSFLDGTGTGGERDDVRHHLRECPRCRFIYAAMRRRA